MNILSVFSRDRLSSMKQEALERTNDVPVTIPYVPQTTNELIEEIHESFYTQVDKLLASAKVSRSLDTDKQALIDKCNRLKSLGFTATKEVVEAEREIKRLSDLKIENEQKQVLIEAINHFSRRYPHYKFITEDSVKRICEKYNLIYGEIGRYIGTVPDRNLKHIEDFKIREEDMCFTESTSDWMSSSGFVMKKYVDFQQKMVKERLNADRREVRFFSSLRTWVKESPLEIAAPLKDFNLERHEVRDFKLSEIEIPDPVVLKPVLFKGQKFYLIVTAWGIEATDSDVLNEKMN